MKRSVLSICFLLALSLSSLCLLSNKIRPVYASSEQIINGGFETGDTSGWYDLSREGSVSTNNTHSGIYCYEAWGYLDLTQWLIEPKLVSEISSFSIWLRSTEINNTFVVFQTSSGGYLYYLSEIMFSWKEYDLKTILLSLVASTSETLEYIRISSDNDTETSAMDDLSLTLSSLSLDIQGDPELNYNFLMNGSAYTTPYSNSNFTSGNITLENNSPSLTVGHFIYTFSYWSINATDNLTSSSFTVDIGGNTTISLVFSKAIMDIAFDPRNIASETVHLADTGSQLGKMLGVNSFIGGLIMSAIICAIFLFPVMIFKRTLLPMAIMGFLGLAISTGLGFLPFWIDLVLLLIISVLFSGKIRDFITGAGN